MNGPLSAIVFFSTGPSKEDFFDEVHRRKTVERGIESILANIRGVRLIQANNFACTASLSGKPEAILQLRDYVDHQALGTVEFDAFEAPALRATATERRP
jgi:hypothetical protein